MAGRAGGRHVFVDESKARDYLLASTILDAADVAPARRVVRSLVLPGQNRLHMTKESDGRRRVILDAIEQLPAETVIHRAPRDGRSEIERRRACLDTLVVELVTSGCTSLCLERDETLERQDRQWIMEALTAKESI
jgi:hypothetical protein